VTSVSAVTGSDIFPLFKKFCGEDLLCCSCHLGILSIVLICYALLLLKSLRKFTALFLPAFRICTSIDIARTGNFIRT